MVIPILLEDRYMQPDIYISRTETKGIRLWLNINVDKTKVMAVKTPRRIEQN